MHGGSGRSRLNRATAKPSSPISRRKRRRSTIRSAAAARYRLRPSGWGLRAYGSDLNPVAVLISKALVEIPPKFAVRAPVNPGARQKLKGVANWSGKGAQGLAEDVRHYGKWMRDEAEKKIGHLYPQVEVTDEAVRQEPSLERLKGQKLTVIAWLWARTVASPNPAAKGAHVPLVSSFMSRRRRERRRGSSR